MATTSQTNAFIVLGKYGVPLSAARYVTLNLFTIPQDMKDIFKSKYLLSWDKHHFMSQIQNGVITRDGIEYQVIYHRASPVDIMNHEGQLLLSFRSLQDEYVTTPTVLVARHMKKAEDTNNG